MAQARWEADWGLRSIPTGDPLYIGDSYGHGSVWPLGTGIQALAFYRYHRPLEAFPLTHALVGQSFLNSLGHVPEVFSGDFYRELDVSVPEQIWSSGMVVTSLLRGMLGLEPYAPMSELQWAPHLPPQWSGVSVKNLRIGRSTLALDMKQSETGIRLKVNQSGPPVVITFAPEIPLGTRNLRATLNGRPIDATIRSYEQDAHAQVKFGSEPSVEVALSFEPGVRPWVDGARLGIGDQSHGLRVLSSKLEGHVYSARVEGRHNACESLSITTTWRAKQVEGGKVSAHQGDQWTFIVSPAPSSCDAPLAASGPSYEPYQTWTFRVGFEP
jgi:hypothetical protein